METEAGGIGYLQVRVSTAQTAIPLENAQVIIRADETQGGNAVAVLRSDQNGITPRVALATVPRSLSEVPGNSHPFYVYHMEVSKEGYYTQYYQNIPVFDGISALQAVEMIPLPQNGYEYGKTPDGNRYFEGENPNL